jgi:hypothetical protein
MDFGKSFGGFAPAARGSRLMENTVLNCLLDEEAYETRNLLLIRYITAVTASIHVTTAPVGISIIAERGIPRA